VNNNVFDEFAREQGGIGSGSVRVSDVLAKGVPIRWDEAVAVLQETLEIATRGAGADPPIPAFEDVVIDSHGAVTINGSRRGERGPVAAGRALHALLATADIPVPLRLFVTQANAPDTHTSLQSFTEGLAYFGRPGRDEMIRAIYQRYQTSAPSTTPSSKQPGVPPPLPPHARADEAAEPRRGPAPWLMPTAVVLAVVSLAAVIWYGVLHGGGDTASVVTEAKAAIGSVATALQIAPKSGKSTAVPAEKAPGTTSAAPSAPRQPSAQGSRGSQKVLSAPNLENGLFATRSLESLRTTPSPSQPAPSESITAPTPAIAVAREYVVAPREDEPTTIYSSADADVQPPVMMFPSLPPTVFVARNADVTVINRMELVIALDGSVERVRLVNGPTRMPDMMLLSGAKLWKFTPAVKDGVPVRYRTTVTWSGFP
jgi:hypothetical protein